MCLRHSVQITWLHVEQVLVELDPLEQIGHIMDILCKETFQFVTNGKPAYYSTYFRANRRPTALVAKPAPAGVIHFTV